jgi:acyl-CoA dehydrogenase
MDFNLTEEQTAFRDVVRRWVDAELPKDLMRKLEADEENYPYIIWDKLKAQGFFGVGIPEEYGGLGGDVVLQMIFAREMARTAGGLLWVWGLTSFGGAKTLATAGTEEQRQKWLPMMAAGDLRVSLSMTEPDGGTDVLGAMKTYADKVDGGWVINGAKMWTTAAKAADRLLVLCRSDRNAAKKHHGLTGLPQHFCPSWVCGRWAVARSPMTTCSCLTATCWVNRIWRGARCCRASTMNVSWWALSAWARLTACSKMHLPT